MRVSPAIALLFSGVFLAGAEAGQSGDGRQQLTPPAQSAEPDPSPDVTVPPSHTTAPLEEADPDPAYSAGPDDRDVVSPEDVPAPGADTPVRTADEDAEITLRDCQQMLQAARQRFEELNPSNEAAEDLLDRAEGHLEAGDASRCMQLVQDAQAAMR